MTDGWLRPAVWRLGGPSREPSCLGPSYSPPGESGLPIKRPPLLPRCVTMRRGVLSPSAAVCGRRIGTPRLIQWLPSVGNGWCAIALPRGFHRPGCGGRWGACIDTRCASVPISRLPERLGRAGSTCSILGRLGLLALRPPLREALPGLAFDASGRGRFRFVGAGRWNAQ